MKIDQSTCDLPRCFHLTEAHDYPIIILNRTQHVGSV